MDWIEKMNAAMDYIEENLKGEIDYEIIAQKACCSVYNFQRMFSFMTDVPLAEYIRRRRLTQAAFELIHQDRTILDLALEYGYDSPVSFARAFFKLHGVNPSEAKKNGIKLKSYPRLSFTLSIKGVEDLNYRIEKMDKMRIAGISKEISLVECANFDQVPKVWNEMYQNHDELRIAKLGNADTKSLMGICHSFEKDKFQYMIGVQTEKEIPDGFTVLEIPELLWVKFECIGPMPDSIQNVWKRIYDEWFPNSGYEMEDEPEIEWYSFDEYTSEEYRSEIWIPIRRSR